MDIFKLLTRSSKLSKSAKASAGQPDSTLPSAGQTPNPHLFGRDENLPTKLPVLGKRKRKQAVVEEVPVEVDFFASTATSTKQESVEQQNGDSVVNSHAETPVEENEVEDVEEWKRILKSHKIKISILKGTEEPEPESSTEKKKKKKRKHEVEEKKSKNKAPLAITRPLASFSQLHGRYGVGKRVIQNIQKEGYTAPTEIQAIH